MTPVNDHDDGALDALMFLAFLDETAQKMPQISGPEPDLDAEDQRALGALGPDLVARVLAGQAPPPRAAPAPRPASPGGLRLSAAMNRGGPDGEITRAAREEMERKMREREGDGEASGGGNGNRLP